MSLNQREDELQSIVKEYVSTEDLEQYAILQEKIEAANKKVEEYIKQQAKEEYKKQYDKELDIEENENKRLPHYIDINVEVTVKRTDKDNQEPYIIEVNKNIYQIDFITDDHKKITNDIFDTIQTLLTEKCQLNIEQISPEKN